jgi:hypothetical protein
MKNYKLMYNGNATKFKRLNEIVSANSKREAVEDYYRLYLDKDCFEQDNGDILNCNGDLVANPDDEQFEFDGGYFYAIEIPEINCKLTGNILDVFVSLNDETVLSFNRELNYVADCDNVSEDLSEIIEFIDTQINEAK